MMEVCLGWLTAMLCAQTWVLSRVWSESEVLWRRTLAVNPIDHAAMGSLGSLMHTRKLHSEAIMWHERAIATKGDYSPYHANLGNALQSAGRLQEAHREYVQSIELVTNGTDYHTKSIKSLPDAYYNLGLLYLHTGDAQAALGVFSEALKQDPDHVEVLNSQGYLLISAGHPEPAITALSHALEIEPDNYGTPIAQTRLSQISDTARRHSICLLSPAIHHLPSHHRILLALNTCATLLDVLNNLGNAQQSVHDFDSAIETYRRAMHAGELLSRKGGDGDGGASARGNLVLALTNQGMKRSHHLGDSAGALASMEAALALDPTNTGVLAHRDRLLAVRM